VGDQHPETHDLRREQPALFVADLNTVLFGRALDTRFDGLHFITVILGCIVFVIDIAPRSPNMLFSIDRVFVVHRIGELHVSILVFTFCGTHVFTTVDFRHIFLLTRFRYQVSRIHSWRCDVQSLTDATTNSKNNYTTPLSNGMNHLAHFIGGQLTHAIYHFTSTFACCISTSPTDSSIVMEMGVWSLAEDKLVSSSPFGALGQGQTAPAQARPIEAASSERHAAFTALYRQYLPYVYRYALSRTGSIADAQDITSQTFLAGFEQYGRYQGRAKISTWLLGIAHHKVIDHLRQRQHTSLEQMETDPLAGLNLEASVEQSLSIERVAQAMSILSADRREALSLHLFGELNIQETADVMQRTYAATQMLIQRGLTDLRTRLQEEQ
jgi:RNA polymerase sigma-70 factor, ECF subfamily